MNLIDAVKSGRPFKRKGEDSWREPIGGAFNRLFGSVEILADDWEIQEPAVTITAYKFEDAFNAAWAEYERSHSHPKVLRQILARKLGLEDK